MPTSAEANHIFLFLTWHLAIIVDRHLLGDGAVDAERWRDHCDSLDLREKRQMMNVVHFAHGGLHYIEGPPAATLLGNILKHYSAKPTRYCSSYAMVN